MFCLVGVVSPNVMIIDNKYPVKTSLSETIQPGIEAQRILFISFIFREEKNSFTILMIFNFNIYSKSGWLKFSMEQLANGRHL